MTTVRERVPTGPDDVDDGFLTTVFGVDVQLVGHEPVGVGVGQAGQVFRLRLAGPESIPDTVILKLPPAAPENLATQSVFDPYRREVRFYRELAPSLPIRLPRCHWSVADTDSAAGALLLEDLGDWLTASQVDGADLQRAGQAMELAARIHGWGWERSDLTYPETFDAAPYDLLGPAYRQCVPAFLERFDHVLPAGAATVCERIGACYEQIVAIGMRSAPTTLCHGDFRLDNLMFAAVPDDRDSGGAATVLDWQIPYRAPGVADLAMFLTQSIEPELRARSERDLIGRWHEVLTQVQPAAATYLLSAALADYRLMAMCVTFIPVVCGATYDLSHPRSRALLETLARRGITAVLELDSVALLP